MADSKLKVLSYNIHKGFSVGKIKFLLDEIRSVIRLVNADLVYLQEVCGERLPKAGEKRFKLPDESQFEFLADSVWSHYAYGKNAVYSKGHHGNAVLSKLPIISSENIDISVLGFSQRGILHTVIQEPETDCANANANANHKPIHLLCVHLGLFEAERRSQISKLCQLIKKVIPADEPLILAGDFNDWRLKADKVLLESLNLQEGHRTVHGNLARTYPVWMPVLQLDRIYYRGIKVIQAERLTGAPWSRLSDHAALYMEIEL